LPLLAAIGIDSIWRHFRTPPPAARDDVPAELPTAGAVV
jgi:hypothetical protein